MKRVFYLTAVVAFLLGLTGCYQVHSDDDLRDIPVTNNPTLIPGGNGPGSFTAMP